MVQKKEEKQRKKIKNLKTQKKSSVISYNDLSVFHFAQRIKKDRNGKKATGIIFGNFGAQNYGDEAILAGQLEELKKIECAVTVVSRFPRLVQKMHNVKTLRIKNISKVVKTINKSDFVLVGGGGLFCKNDGGLMGIVFQLYSLLLFFLLPLMLHKKIYVIGIGFYDNTNKIIARIAQQLLKKADIVTVRDEHSYLFLRKANVQAFFYKDNSFLMKEASQKELLKKIELRKYFKKKKYNIGVAIKKPSNIQEEKHLTKTVSDFMMKNTYNTTYWIYPMDAHNGYANDLDYAKEIKQMVEKTRPNTAEIHIIPTTWHPSYIVTAIGMMDYMLSLRLHASIFSYRTKTPFYPMTYDKKCTSFIETINKKPIEIAKVSIVDMQKEYKKIIARKIKIRKSLPIASISIKKRNALPFYPTVSLGTSEIEGNE